MKKRDAICDAALELFAQQGVENTTIREIAMRADASEGALYRHFDGKADLADWLYDRCTGELRSHMGRSTTEDASPETRLEELVRGLFEFYASRPASCTYLLSAQPGEGDGDVSAPLGLFTDVLEEGTKGSMGPPPMLRAGWILAMVQRTVRFLKAGMLDVDGQTAVDQTVAAALRLAQSEGPTRVST